MKIAGTIVDKNMSLIGLLVKCKPSEIGVDLKESYIMRPFKLEEVKKLIKSGKISDFKVDKKDNIVGKNNKKLSDLPMFDSRGNFVDKRIQLTKVIEIDNKLAGGQVLFLSNSSSKKLKIDDLVFLYNYCDATNFILKNKDDNYFITGKGETKKEDIPVEEKVVKNIKKNEKIEEVNVDSKELSDMLYNYYINLLYLYPKYNKVSDTYILIPYFSGVGSYYLGQYDNDKLYSYICNQKFFSKYFTFFDCNDIDYSKKENYIGNKKIEYSDNTILYYPYTYDFKKLCMQKNGCKSCSYYPSDCGLEIAFYFYDNSPRIYFGLEQFVDDSEYVTVFNSFDCFFSKISKLSRDTKIGIEFNFGSKYTYIYNTEEEFIKKFPIFANEKDEICMNFVNEKINDFLIDNCSQILVKKLNKNGLEGPTLTEVDTVYKNKDGVPLLEYCKPAKGYPLGYFKLLVK